MSAINCKLKLQKRLPLIIIGLSLSFFSQAQSTETLDSLESIDLLKYPDSTILDVYNTLSSGYEIPSIKLDYANKLIRKAQGQDPIWLMRGYLQQGNAHSLLSDYEMALRSYFEALNYAGKVSPTKVAIINITIADTYKAVEDYQKSYEYYQLAKENFLNKETLSKYDSIYSAMVYINFGDLFLVQKKYDSALSFFQKAQIMAKASTYGSYDAIIRGNIAIVYAGIDKDLEAEAEIKKAIEYFDKQNHWDTVAEFLIYMADIYLDQNELDNAIDYALRSYNVSKKHGLKKRIQDASFRIYKINLLKNDYREALNFHEEYALYRDSILNRETIQKMADQKTEFEVGQKQAEVDLLTAEKRTQQVILFSTAGGALFVVVLLGLVYKNYRDKNRINKVLEDQKAQLEALNSTKDKFFSIISHDLRGPVSAFSGITRLIKHAVQNKEHDDLIEISDHIDESVEHLSGLLDNLLSWAMQQQGHFPNVPEKLSLKALSDEIKGIFSNMADAKQIDLEVNVPDGINLWADKNTSMTILRNLVNNALKFTKSGGEVKVAAEQHENMAVIIVSDTGVGMSEEKLKTLFQLQGTKSDFGTSGEKGLGLGLQLVYEFVELNNGTIEVESEEGKGTQFTIQLPLFESVSQEVAS